MSLYKQPYASLCAHVLFGQKRTLASCRFLEVFICFTNLEDVEKVELASKFWLVMHRKRTFELYFIFLQKFFKCIHFTLKEIISEVEKMFVLFISKLTPVHTYSYLKS